MTTTKVLVFKLHGEWVLRISIYQENKISVTEIKRDKLIEVLDIACMLRLHIDNEWFLPVNQYLKQAS